MSVPPRLPSSFVRLPTLHCHQDKDGDGLVTVGEIVDGLGVTEKEAAKILKKHGGKGGLSAEQVMDKKADKALRKVRQKQEDEEER